MRRWCVYKRTFTDMMGSGVVEVEVTRGEKEVLSTKGI